MMWIEDYMAREGLSPEQMAQRVCEYGGLTEAGLTGQPSGMLIRSLVIGRGNGYTHPHFADAIAAVCGATPKQRDEIVAERYRGTWQQTPADRRLAAEAARRQRQSHPWRANPAVRREGKADHPYNIYRRPVVKVDRRARPLRRFESVEAAAIQEHMDVVTVRNRCRRRTLKEFKDCGHTYRYADEWDRMTREEQLRDVGGA